MIGVVILCTITPYNNYALANTDMIGSHLPVGLLMLMVAFILLINAPLHRYAPRQALQGGELAVALGMMLVGCALPSVGLMRYLPGHLVAMFHHSALSLEAAELMRRMNLPDWVFPRFTEHDPALRGNEPIVRDFYSRIVLDDPTFLNRLLAIPWSDWLMPALSWGVFFLLLATATLTLTIIFRRQWVENERLPFPLAQIYLSLIETPEEGRALNSLFRSPMLWGTIITVFVLHGFNGLSRYFPQYVPAIPLDYNLEGVLADSPLRFAQREFQRQFVFFTLIGITYFLQSKVAFSLWFFFLMSQLARVFYGQQQAMITEAMERDQIFGAAIPFAAVVLWVGRHHLRVVIGQMFRLPRPGEPQGRYLPYAAAGWGFVLSLIGLVIWLWLAGASIVGGIVIVLMLMLIYLVLMRIVAETGMLYVLIPITVHRPFQLALTELPGGIEARTTLPSFFYAAKFSGMLTHDTRESLGPFVMHAMRVADSAAYDGVRHWRKAVGFTGCLVLALVVAFVVSGAATLYAHYSTAHTLDRAQVAPIGVWGSQILPKVMAIDQTVAYQPDRGGPPEPHNPTGHFLFGAGLTAFLSIMRLRYEAWPFHPVGFILAYTWGLKQVWFSIFLGWLAKVLILRFGGSSAFRSVKPLFMGLILGEALSAGFWLIVTLILAWLGLDYHAIRLLPA